MSVSLSWFSRSFFPESYEKKIIFFSFSKFLESYKHINDKAKKRWSFSRYALETSSQRKIETDGICLILIFFDGFLPKDKKVRENDGSDEFFSWLFFIFSKVKRLDYILSLSAIRLELLLALKLKSIWGKQNCEMGFGHRNVTAASPSRFSTYTRPVISFFFFLSFKKLNFWGSKITFFMAECINWEEITNLPRF